MNDTTEDLTDLAVTRDGYDALAVRYVELFTGELAARPLDRAMLTAFAELVREGGGGPVADLGSGPGWVTAYLHDLGLDVYGRDLSPVMAGLARDAYPGLRFEVGGMEELGVPDGSLAGIVARYSLIHTPPERVPAVLAGFHRALAPGAPLLLAFQADPEPEPDDPDEPGQPGETAPTPFDHKVAPAYRWTQGALSARLRTAGLVEVARLTREPREDERFLQAHLLARRPAAAPRKP